jgi:hypothetical protein
MVRRVAKLLVLNIRFGSVAARRDSAGFSTWQTAMLSQMAGFGQE